MLLLLSAAYAQCPGDETIQGALTCSSEITETIDHTEDSHLGGTLDGEEYTCGDPWPNQDQIAPEHVWSFTCQLAGTVRMLITDLPCDLDIYVLDDTCDPYAGCLYGSTQSYAVDDEVTFECSPGQTYYIVVEAYGTEHLDIASGPCTDSDGNVYSPDYTLSFDVSSSTGCAEDCNNGEDDDLDGDVDCDDQDCWTEPFCCERDGDGYWDEECGGDDCDDDDASVHPGAREDGGSGDRGNGVDDDCDDIIDEGTLDYDDDGDGWTEMDGDCDDADPDVNPGQEEIPDNGKDDDCDGVVDTEEEPSDDTGEAVGEKGDGNDRECGCAATGSVGALGVLALMGLVGIRRRT